MTRLILPSMTSTQAKRPQLAVTTPCFTDGLVRLTLPCALAVLGIACTLPAQITIDSRTGVITNGANGSTQSPVDRRYQQIKPTNVPLTKTELDPKTRLELIRLIQAEQGFAMRPFPRGHKGLTLVANGKLEPAGEAYVAMVTSEGLSAKPGDRVVLTDLKIDRNKIVFELNGGPDVKHRLLRHIQIGAGPEMNPVVQQGNDQEPVGARLTLTFSNHVPELSGAEVKALLAPLISFDVKTPIQAFTDTLPQQLKDAILNHHVLVGMSTDMVFFAKGQPESKSREMEGQMPFEEWIYGKPPQEVDFVRINGNRVIRVEVAKMGETPEIFTKDVVEGLMRTDGTALEASATPHASKVGDVQRDPDKEAPSQPPSLMKPGEASPDADADKSSRVGVMKPVQFPKPKTDPQPGANPDGEPEAQQPAAQTPQSAQPPGDPAKAQTTPSSSTPSSPTPSPSDATQPSHAKPQPPPPADANQFATLSE
jgi:hypothetical protein